MTRMTTCLKEEEIERLAMGGGSPAEAVKRHLLSCDRCRERYLALIAMYGRLISGGQGAAVDASARERGRRVVVLFPLQDGFDVSDRRLAAKGGGQTIF